MKKQFVMITITTILVTVGLSGCNENINTENGKSSEEEILGVWGGITVGDNETALFNFYSNGNFSLNTLLADFYDQPINRKTVWGNIYND